MIMATATAPLTRLSERNEKDGHAGIGSEPGISLTSPTNATEFTGKSASAIEGITNATSAPIDRNRVLGKSTASTRAEAPTVSDATSIRPGCVSTSIVWLTLLLPVAVPKPVIVGSWPRMIRTAIPVRKPIMTEWETKRGKAIATAEGKIKAIWDNYGRTFKGGLMERWLAMSGIMAVVLVLVIVFQKRKDVV